MGIENEIAKQAGFSRARVASLTPVLDTSIYAAGDVLFDTVIIPGVFPVAGGALELRSIEVLDEDDQGVALDLLFFDSLASLGAFNGAPTITDVLARSCLGFISIATGDYIDLGLNRIASKNNIGMVLQAAALAQDLYVAAITRGGTPTYTAAGLKFKFGFY